MADYCEEEYESRADDEYQTPLASGEGYVGGTATGSGNFGDTATTSKAAYEDDFDGLGYRKGVYVTSTEGPYTSMGEYGLLKGDNGHQELGIGTGSLGWQANDSTIGAGGQVNLVEGALKTDEANDVDDDGESYIRGGGSIGVGAAARAHHGDADGDGVHEYGFGFDLGPVSFDVKSEHLDLGYTADCVATGLSDWWESF